MIAPGDLRAGEAAAESSVAPRGFTAFATVLFGQVVSMLGSGLTGFALGVWVYQRTGSATRFALVTLCAMLPVVALSPVAGALVDRWDRRKAMLVGDSGSALATLALAGLAWSGRLELWHVYPLLAAGSSFAALQWPAFSAATTLLVPRRHLARAGGMTQLGVAAAQILAPLLAGALVGAVGLRGVVLLDFASFLVALLTLALVRFPPPPLTAEGRAAHGSLLAEARQGWLYIRRRPGLRAMLLLLAAANFSLAILQVLVTPLVLGFASVEVLGVVLGVAGCGMLAGSLAMSVWGGPRRRVHGILGALLGQGLILLVGGLRPNAALVAAAAFVFLFATPIGEACSQAIWQSKVAPDLQGRVFAVRRMVAWSTLPLGYLLAGPLADHVFVPLLLPGGPLADSVGRAIGVGPGRGIALLFLVLGLLVLATVAVAARQPRLLHVETELPDAVPDTPPLTP
ncbi:MAG TPA: MFS transporter [Thermoanaerobaculia bacterium]|nr:MFS transporter [Thermoanaerobaculia bacterium]